jgi:hypothetical protein
MLAWLLSEDALGDSLTDPLSPRERGSDIRPFEGLMAESRTSHSLSPRERVTVRESLDSAFDQDLGRQG